MKITSEDIFSPFGLLKKKKDKFSYREGQEEMAKKVEEAFNENKGCLIEAGTGIGKSFAYLVPALLLTKKDPDVRVVIATSTTTLQKQLFDLDIPFLSNLLSIDPGAAVLYGRSNYICKKKLTEYTASIGLLTLDKDSNEAKFIRWCERTDSGCRLDIESKELSIIASTLASDEESCLGQRCPAYLDCFLYNARRNAQNARIIVTNHHVVIVDSLIRWENESDFSSSYLLPGYTHLVLDEAHHIENEATELYSERFSLPLLNEVLDFLTFKKGETGGKNIIEFLSPVDSSPGRFFTRDFESTQKKIRHDSSLFMQKLKGMIAQLSQSRSVLLEESFFSSYSSYLKDGNILVDEIVALSNDLIHYLKTDNETFLPYYEIVTKSAGTLYELALTLKNFLSYRKDSKKICYASLIDDGSYEIILSPLLAGPLIKERLLDKLESYLFCSATLSISGNFDYFKSRLSISSKDDIIEGIYLSPFDYSKNLMYLVPEDAHPFVVGDNTYIDYVADSVRRAIEASSGGALVLFTSIDMMKKVYTIVKSKINPTLPLLIQDNRISRASLLSSFKENIDSSLFATQSFWEGVDAPGNTLRLLVIVKLPFDVPTDPVNKARADYINETEEKGSFALLTLPNAMIKMKQGIGRVIRSESDRGVVLILDGRISRKFYSRLLFSSIPPGFYPEDTMLENIENKIESFLF